MGRRLAGSLEGPQRRVSVAMTITFTESDVSTATNALRIAAEKFDGYVTEFATQDKRLADHFERQAKESRALADRLDEAE